MACLETLEPGFAATMAGLGIELIPATPGEVDRLEANLLSLGGRRVVAPAGDTRINGALRRRGFELIEVEIDQFVRCGGGVHCLTMPLARSAPCRDRCRRRADRPSPGPERPGLSIRRRSRPRPIAGSSSATPAGSRGTFATSSAGACRSRKGCCRRRFGPRSSAAAWSPSEGGLLRSRVRVASVRRPAVPPLRFPDRRGRLRLLRPGQLSLRPLPRRRAAPPGVGRAGSSTSARAADVGAIMAATLLPGARGDRRPTSIRSRLRFARINAAPCRGRAGDGRDEQPRRSRRAGRPRHRQPALRRRPGQAPLPRRRRHARRPPLPRLGPGRRPPDRAGRHDPALYRKRRSWRAATA